MTVIDSTFARALATEWVEAWNAHDVERVLRHYAEDVVLQSPFIAQIAGEPSGRLEGKAALRAYWTRALQMLPSLRFEIIDVLAGVGSMCVYYRGHRGTVAETFFFDPAGKIRLATACYALQPVATR